MHRTQQSLMSSENNASIFEEKLLKISFCLILEETKIFYSKFTGFAKYGKNMFTTCFYINHTTFYISKGDSIHSFLIKFCT